MPVVKPGTKEGAYGDVSVYRGIGGFGISVLYRPGRSYRPEASSLTSILLTNAPPANANAVAAVKTANVRRFFTNVAPPRRTDPPTRKQRQLCCFVKNP